MKKLFFVIAMMMALQISFAEEKKMAQNFEKDTFECDGKNLEITFIKHGTLMFDFGGTIIHIDPVLMFGTDYSALPKADIVIVTHEHGDHYDAKAIRQVVKNGTKIITNKNVSKMMKNEFKNVTVMANGDNATIDGIKIDAVPAYNNSKGHTQFHPKGRDNGFVMTFGGTVCKRVYVSGDTEDIPELADLKAKGIDIAFLSANQPYTMTAKQCVNAAKMFCPKILYPYHYGDTNVSEITKGVEDSGTEVRIRELQ